MNPEPEDLVAACFGLQGFEGAEMTLESHPQRARRKLVQSERRDSQHQRPDRAPRPAGNDRAAKTPRYRSISTSICASRILAMVANG